MTVKPALFPLPCRICGVTLEPYEIFACRIRGLKTPVCLGCLIDMVLTVKKAVVPVLEGAIHG